MPHTVEFSEDLKARVREAGRKIHDILPFLDDAEACGVNCQLQRDLLNTLRSTLGEIEARFFGDNAKGG